MPCGERGPEPGVVCSICSRLTVQSEESRLCLMGRDARVILCPVCKGLAASVTLFITYRELDVFK